MESNKDPLVSLDESAQLLSKRIDRLYQSIDKLKPETYFELIEQPSRMMWLNFLAGVSRGIGMALGFAFFSAAIVYSLGRLVKLDLPLIGGFIADIVKIVQAQLGY